MIFYIKLFIYFDIGVINICIDYWLLRNFNFNFNSSIKIYKFLKLKSDWGQQYILRILTSSRGCNFANESTSMCSWQREASDYVTV